MRVFDFGEMREMFKSDPGLALSILGLDVERGAIDANLRDLQAIGGAPQDEADTVRIIVDLKLKLVQQEKGGQ